MPKDNHPAVSGPFAPRDIAAGFRRCVPLAFSVFAYGGVLGVLADAKGITVPELMLMSLVVFAGSSQFVAAELWAPVLPVAEIALATLVINLRYLLIGASLRDVFAGTTLIQKLLGIHMVADENWAVTMAAAREGRATPGFLWGGGLIMMLFWQAGCILGQILGGGIPEPERFGLDFAFTAAFLALATGLWEGRRDLVPWGLAVAGAIAGALWLPGKWYILLGSGLGFVAAAVLWTEDGGD